MFTQKTETQRKSTFLPKPRKYQSKNEFNYCMIKWRIAETLVEQLFLELWFQVFNYGMENTIPWIMDLLKWVDDDVSYHIRKAPDLVVYKDNHAHFVEVKFRANETFTIKDLEKEKWYPYKNALFVIVSKRHIKCISYEELKAWKEITEHSHNYLWSRKEFETDKNKIIEYCKYAVKFFSHI